MKRVKKLYVVALENRKEVTKETKDFSIALKASRCQRWWIFHVTNPWILPKIAVNYRSTCWQSLTKQLWIILQIKRKLPSLWSNHSVWLKNGWCDWREAPGFTLERHGKLCLRKVRLIPQPLLCRVMAT